MSSVGIDRLHHNWGKVEMALNCVHYYGGKCTHPCSKTFFGHKPCVITDDVRVSVCDKQISHPKPMPPCAPPKGR